MSKTSEEARLEELGSELADQIDAIDPEDDAALAAAVSEKMKSLVLAAKPVIEIHWDDDGEPSGGDKYRVEMVKDSMYRFVLREFDTAVEAEEFGLSLAEFIYPRVTVDRGAQDAKER